MKFYLLRINVAIYLIKLITRLLFVDTPPVIAVSALIKRGGKMLFIKHTYINGYGIPGGIVRQGESLETALNREVFEETGLRIQTVKYFKSYIGKSKGISKVIIVFVVKASGQLKSSKEGEPVFLHPRGVKEYAYPDAKLSVRDYVLSK